MSETTPTYPSWAEEPAPAPTDLGPPPPPVANAVRLMFVRVGLSLLGLLAVLTTRSDLRQRLRDADPTLSATSLDTAVTVALVVAVGFALVFAVLYALLALQVRRGRSWARIVTLVLAGLSVLLGLVGLLQGAPAARLVVGLLGLVIDLAVFVLLVGRRSAEWFRPRPRS